MITTKSFDQGAQIELELTGQVSRDDYETTLIPAIETALTAQDQLRILVLMDEGFEGFDLGAAWADIQMGLTHWRGFDRIAVVAAAGWIKTGVRIMAPLMPCPVQLFAPAEAEAARRWLRQSLGTVHMEVLPSGALHVQLMGKLDPQVLARAEDGLDAHIRASDNFRLLLDLGQFEGWQGLSALGAHFKLVREHAPQASKLAILGDKGWQHMGQRVASHFLNAETQFFEISARAQAETWLEE